MEPLLAFSSWHYVYSVPLSIVSVFLILVILVQRGRGGGLTGALGGMGGQSAFGTKAGDLFTKITIVVAAVWILLSMLAIQRLGRYGTPPRPAASAQQGGGDDKTSTDAKDAATDAKKASGDKAGDSKPGEVKATGKKADAKTPAAPAGDAGKSEK